MITSNVLPPSVVNELDDERRAKNAMDKYI